MERVDFEKIVSIISIAALFTIGLLIFSLAFKVSQSSEIDFLTNEMTLNPVRQQKALDKLSTYSVQELKCFAPYFKDRRKIASPEVKFLNTSSMVEEKYFLTGGETVGEVLIQYVCWRSTLCMVTSTSNLDEIRSKLEADLWSNELNDMSSSPKYRR